MLICGLCSLKPSMLSTFRACLFFSLGVQALFLLGKEDQQMQHWIISVLKAMYRNCGVYCSQLQICLQ